MDSMKVEAEDSEAVPCFRVGVDGIAREGGVDAQSESPLSRWKISACSDARMCSKLGERKWKVRRL